MNYRQGFDDEFQRISNMISLSSAVMSIILIIVLVCLKYRILNRMTLRFQALIAILDIVRHLSYIGFEAPRGPLCTFIGFMVYFDDHLFVFLNVMIAINVQLLYIYDIRPKKFFERLYLTCSFLLTFMINFIPLLDDAFGKNDQGYCTLKRNHTNRMIYKLIIVYTATTPGVIGCLISFLVVWSTLKLRLSEFETRWPNKTIIIYGENVDSQSFIKKLFFRMSLYPVSCFTGMFPYLIANFLYDIFNFNHPLLYFLARFGRSSVGSLNLISLLYDPHFQLAISSIWNQSRLSEFYKFKFDRKNEDSEELENIMETDWFHENLMELEVDEESLVITDYIRYC